MPRHITALAALAVCCLALHGGGALAAGVTLDQALTTYERGDFRTAEKQFRALSQLLGDFESTHAR